MWAERRTDHQDKHNLHKRAGQDSPLRKRERVSACDATHCSSASALQTRFEACAERVAGDRNG